MKIKVDIIYKALAAVLICMTSSTLMAQEYVNAQIEVSKEKVKIDGRICYSHIVQEKQTLYSICKAYGVSIEDIYHFNPTVKDNGLKKNSILIIPAPIEQKAEQKIEPKFESKAEQKVEQNTEHSSDKPVRFHIAKWYEDLEGIAAQYGVSTEDIIKANKLKGKKFSKRQKLLIPYTSSEPVQKQDTIPSQSHTVDVVIEDNIQEPQIDSTAAAVIPDQKVNATLLMPLTNAEGEPNRNNMDFYCGVLLAVYDMAEQGINCNLNVYDTMDSKSQFYTETIQNSDVVIGPVSEADLTRLFYATSGVNAVVSPLDPRAEKLLNSHSEMIQAPTSQKYQHLDLVKWMKEELSEGDKVMMITEKGARQNGVANGLREALDSAYIAYNTFSYSILEGRDVTEPLTGLMTTEGANRVIIASESEAFVNDVIRNINLLIYNNLDIVVYAPSKIRSFETIEVENFHNSKMHVSLAYHIDYNSDEVRDFLLKYRALYNTEPTQFAFQGYDLARYFMGLSAKYGKNWKEHLTESPAKMLQSTFSFTRHPSGSFMNNGVRRIIYDKGYQIKKVL